MVINHVLNGMILQVVGGFHPFEKYESNWESSPIFGVTMKKYLKPPPSEVWDPDFPKMRLCKWEEFSSGSVDDVRYFGRQVYGTKKNFKKTC